MAATGTEITTIGQAAKHLGIVSDVILPEGYTQVEYVQTSGSVYFETNYKHTGDTRITMDIEPKMSESSTYLWMFEGSYNRNENGRQGLYTNLDLPGLRFIADYGSQRSGIISDVPVLQRLNVDFNKNILTINKTKVTFNKENFTSTSNMVLLAARYDSTVTGYFPAILYSCKIYDNDVLIRNYVPCTRNSDGVSGLYDTVQKTFNAGVGGGSVNPGPVIDAPAIDISKIKDRPITLKQLRSLYYKTPANDGESSEIIQNVPEDYEPLDYIENKESCYIDTGVSPTGETGFDLTLKLDPSNTGDHQIMTSISNSVYFTLRVTSKGGGISARYGTQSLIKLYTPDPWTDKHTVSMRNGSYSVDGSTAASFNKENFEIARTLYLFDQNTDDGRSFPTKARVYRLTIYENETAIRDFVPVSRKSDNEVGMYDLIGKTFYKSSGEGTLVAGRNINSLDKKFVRISQLRFLKKFTPVSWSEGSDSEIVEMVELSKSGRIKLTDYWHEGEARNITIAPMPYNPPPNQTGTNAAQTIQYVITDPGHFMLEDGSPCNFVIVPNVLTKKQVAMHDRYNQDDLEWNNCLFRDWLNLYFYTSIPESIRPVFRPFITYSASYATYSKLTESVDHLCLFSEVELTGVASLGLAESQAKDKQLNYFKSHPTSFSNTFSTRTIAYRNMDRGGYFVVMSGRRPTFIVADASLSMYPFGCV